MRKKTAAVSGFVTVVAASLATALACGAAEGPDGKIQLVTNGASAFSIIVPDGEDVRRRVGQAAELLQKTIEAAAGVKLPVVKEAEAPAGKPAIYLGKTRAAQDAKLPLADLKGWMYLKQVCNGNVFLAGADEPMGGGIKDRPDLEYLGTYKAVTSFLEDEVGVRFLLPGPNGIHIPKLTTLAVDAKLNVRRTPLFEYCTGRATFDKTYDIAQDNFWQTNYKNYGGHSYYDAVPKNKYGKDHPEYFAMIGGVRSPSENHLCISNPEVQELMLKEMEAQLDLGYQWVQLAQTDGYAGCGCPSCQALGPDDTERLWTVHRKLALEMQKQRPGKKVVMIMY